MEGNSKNDRSVYSATMDTPDGFVQPEGQALYVVEEMDTSGAIVKEYVVEAASRAAAKSLIAAGRFKARSASARDVARLYGAEIVKASGSKDSTITRFANRIVGSTT